ncbi:MAG: CHAT domain-containing protein, partial [Thermoleophilia bacterium]|nr:CHAT domain-containing protein [Thermoleophilia bacterium]
LDAGRREEGIALLRETLDGRRRAQGPQHPLTGRVMEQLGNALVENGQLAAGTSLIDEALTIRVAALGEQHHVIGNTLLRLGEAHAKAGSHDEALDDLNRALEVLRGAVGDEHPGVAEVHRARARLYRDTDQPGRALDEALRAEAIGRDHLRLTARALPETSALRYAEMRQSALSLAMSTAMKLGTDDALGRVWDAVIRSRAVVLDEMAARNRSLVQGGAETEILAEVVVAARARLARLMIQNLDEQENGRIADLMQEARNERNRAERALAAASAEFAAREARTGAGREQVVAGLPTDTSLLSFVRFEREGTGAPAYVAFVQGVDVGAPAAIDLGPAAPIESAIRAWREALIGVSRAEMRDRERGYRLVGERLRNLVWDPLVKSLGSATRVLIVPDGALHLVSFAALPIGKRRYLVESGPLLHYVSSERDILTRGADAPLGSGLLAVGGPAYDVKAATLSALRQGDTFRGRRSVCADFQLRRFQPLPQTRAEVDDIVRLWNDSAGDDLGRAVLRTGSSASEAAFKHEASGRRVLHLATHGFFLGDNCVGEGEPGTLLGSPLLGAGLAMAGANQRASAAADTEDGILTAEEIGALDLAGVEWTVLSACDTGVGEIRAGEGVLGLRRAFEVAGTRTLILSLWPVEDRSARLWMRELYRARLEDGKDVGDASRSASLALLERRRADGTGGHPAGWAAFVAAGAWR